MNAIRESDPRTSNGATVPTTEVKRSEVRPEVSFWDITEVKKSRFAQTIRSIVQGLAIIPMVAALGFIVREVLRTEGLSETAKMACVIAVTSTLAILGLAALFVGAKNNAETSEDHSDQSADPGNA